jgi:hypothetical protein
VAEGSKLDGVSDAETQEGRNNAMQSRTGNEPSSLHVMAPSDCHSTLPHGTPPTSTVWLLGTEALATTGSPKLMPVTWTAGRVAAGSKASIRTGKTLCTSGGLYEIEPATTNCPLASTYQRTVTAMERTEALAAKPKSDS